MGRLAVACIVSSWVVLISILVNRIVPDPYMDEIFHIPQAQQYCKGNFKSWDPMITTPPGLYFLSLVHVAALNLGRSCSTAILRSTNAVLAVICSVLIYEIISHLRPSLNKRKATFYAVVLALYPLQWFFTFLYYTDVASLTTVLAMYYMSLKKNYIFSALLGALAVSIRQTNIIWMLFVACTGVIDCTLTHREDRDQSVVSKNQKQTLLDSNKGTNLRKRRSVNGGNSDNRSITRNTDPSKPNPSGLFDEIHYLIISSWHLKRKLLVSFSPYLIVLLAFSAFVLRNGGIVLGAKEAHTVSPHFAQLLYFALVSALFMAPVCFGLDQALALFNSFRKNRITGFLQWIIALIIGLLWVHFFSIAHPYLLADNRHYTFYIWRKIINYHWLTKYLLVPLYIYSWFSIAAILGKVEKKTWVLGFFLACGATLVPAPLMEFRYFTIPFFFFILHSDVKDDRSWLLVGIIFAGINLFTMTMFLRRPFYWDHEAATQRFIW